MKLNVFDKDVREDGTIPQYCENGPAVTTYYMPLKHAHYDYENKYFAFNGFMYGAWHEIRIPFDFVKEWIEKTGSKQFEYDFVNGKLKDYYYMWR